MNILVTGGASGLGKAIVEKLATDKSCKVYFTYANSSSKAAAIEAEYTNTKGLQCDFTIESSLQNLLETIPTLDLDILVNNAHTGTDIEHLHKIKPETLLKGFSNNIIPAIQITQQAIQSFKKKKFGKIINIITSAVVNKPPTGWAEYVASKAYFMSMSKSWATECIKFNITANCISPAFMLTSMTEKTTDERVIEHMLQNHPLKQLLKPEDVAEAVAFYTRCSQHVNGTNLIINAGNDIV